MLGCGGWLGQGELYESAKPARFFSSKFNKAQHNYSTMDQELLGVLVGCRKMHEHLIGFPFTVVCDHEPLKTYWAQPPKQTRRHVRLWETLSEYNFNWRFLPGKTNELADSLSRLAELVESERVPLENALEPTPAHDDAKAFPSEPTGAGKMVLAGLMAALGNTAASSVAESSPSASAEVWTWLTTFRATFRAALVSAHCQGCPLPQNPRLPFLIPFLRCRRLSRLPQRAGSLATRSAIWHYASLCPRQLTCLRLRLTSDLRRTRRRPRSPDNRALGRP